MNKCPNCKRKLSPFYFKQRCPFCNVNLMYFNMSESLEEDRALAQREISAVRHFLQGIKASSIGSIWGIFKMIGALLQICTLFIPVYYIENGQAAALWDKFSLSALIKSVISPPGELSAGSLITQQILTDKGVLYAVLAFFIVIIFAIISLLVQLFSYTKNGVRLNFTVSAAAVAAFLVLSVASVQNGAITAGGFYVEIALMAVGFVLALPLEKSIREIMNKYAGSEKAVAEAKAAVLEK